LLDFDLYCLGDPGLDIANFVGHVIEQSVRSFGNPTALADREKALEDRFVELSGEATRPAVRATRRSRWSAYLFEHALSGASAFHGADSWSCVTQRLGLDSNADF